MPAGANTEVNLSTSCVFSCPLDSHPASPSRDTRGESEETYGVAGGGQAGDPDIALDAEEAHTGPRGGPGGPGKGGQGEPGRGTPGEVKPEGGTRWGNPGGGSGAARGRRTNGGTPFLN